MKFVRSSRNIFAGMGLSAKTSLINGFIVSILLTAMSFGILQYQSYMITFIMGECEKKIEKFVAARNENQKKALGGAVKFDSDTIGNMAGTFLYNLNADDLMTVLRPYMKKPEIQAVTVLDFDGQPFAAVWKNPEIVSGYDIPETVNVSENLSVLTDSHYEGEFAGKVLIYYTDDLLTDDLHQSMRDFNTEIASLRTVTGKFTEKAFYAEMTALFFIMAAFIASVFLCLKKIAVKPVTRIIDTLDKNSGQLAAVSQKLESASRSLAESTSESAVLLDEASSLLKKIYSVINLNADNAVRANRLTQNSGQAVRYVSLSVTELTDSISGISESGKEISNIIKTIDGIAFQTNLLALNASVEAARAGKAGAGFAVVAGEVRNLAMRTTDAAKFIAGLIENTVERISECSHFASEAGESFAEVADKTQEVSVLVGEIDAASGEQANWTEQLNTITAKMNKAAHQNAANSEETLGFSKEMKIQADQTANIVQELSMIVSGIKTHLSDKGVPRK